ncbi:hypothetical protein O181_102375 [Austropuccinia psidii MF-1]|uniref:Uncharacterized protein n=1 Tax=Austropuccinia psidii MF-1 TaxID=1389203 RepID=A0A9Q3JJF9_9BASI|nr:hypothetical protein [Austropuccinia psidii MF-1]
MIKSWHILKRFLKEEEIGKYSNSWNPLSSKPQIKKIKDWKNKKRDESKEEDPVASTRKPQACKPPPEGNNNRKITGGNHIAQATGSHGQCLQHGHNLYGIQGK